MSREHSQILYARSMYLDWEAVHLYNGIIRIRASRGSGFRVGGLGNIHRFYMQDLCT